MWTRFTIPNNPYDQDTSIPVATFFHSKGVQSGEVAPRTLHLLKLVEIYRSDTASVSTCAIVKTGSMGFKNPRPGVVT